ncbi:MAG: hypothetical protein HOP16_00565 [Acidobacteria bacterium]|nr:hypothetical protein [Acidobacteriota bacterium]
MTIAELLIAAVIASGLIATLFGIADPLQGLFDAQLELAEMHQRLRTGVHAIERDLLAAGPPIMPYRAGARRSDPSLGIYYRDDTISMVSAPWGDRAITSDTYYLRRGSVSGTSQLMHYDGAETDAPVVDHVVGLAFEYVDEVGLSIDPAALQDGPWLPGDVTSGAFDADLLRIRHVRVTLRVQASRETLRGPAGTLFTHGGSAASIGRYLPDREVNIEIAPRNLDRD